MLPSLVQVALGGAAGASARYLTGLAVTRALGTGFPYGTLMVNILGSALMGVTIAVLAVRGNSFAPLITTGFLGGFTTFSTFSLDAIFLIERGETGTAVAYMLFSVLLSLAALWAALVLARGWLA